MSNATPAMFGAVNSSGDRNALFLKVFGGEVMAAFEESNVFLDKTMTRTISSGKSAQFPATWKVVAGYHTPGTEILGQNTNVNERVIVIDDLLVSSVFLSNIDEAKAHYDVRGVYSQEVGRALARTLDRNLAQLVCLSARASATVAGGFGGSVLVNASYASDGAVLASGVFAAAQALDEKDVPGDDRYAVIRPAQYYLLAQTTNVLNKDWGGSGAYADGTVMKIANVAIVKSNNMPQYVVADGMAQYRGDFTNSRGAVFHKSTVGTVKLMDVATESEYQISRQGTLVVAKYALGSDILRPEASVELRIA
jgi:hypothetical protein